MRVAVCPTMVEPQEYEVHSSSSDRWYTVTTPTLYTEGICDPECKGYMYRGTCRHISKAVDEAVCFFGTKDPNIKNCRQCGRELIVIFIPET